MEETSENLIDLITKDDKPSKEASKLLESVRNSSKKSSEMKQESPKTWKTELQDHFNRITSTSCTPIFRDILKYFDTHFRCQEIGEKSEFEIPKVHS